MAQIEDLTIKVSLTNEMLEQIRTIVREEITAALGVLTDEKHILGRKLEAGLISLDEYKAATSNLAAKPPTKTDYTLNVIMETVEEGIFATPLSVTAQLEYEGKIYEGELYLVKHMNNGEINSHSWKKITEDSS